MTLTEATASYIQACRDHDNAQAHEYYEAIRLIRHREVSPREALIKATPFIHARGAVR